MNEQLFDRLAEADLSELTTDLVLAAATGTEELSAAIGGTRPVRPDPVGAPDGFDRRIYLDDVTVVGFRGIADRATLSFPPGPGLTLVVGRNGSGKSSFAEAAELAMTQASQRWDRRTRSWADGWANLHHAGPRRIAVRLRTNGDDARTTVSVDWAADATLTERTSVAQRAGDPQVSLAAIGLDEPLQTWSPFLSYDDLGSLLEVKQTELHDRLSDLLGLEDWTAVRDRLVAAKKQLAEVEKVAKATAKTLRADLEALEEDGEERAATARKAIGATAKTWKLAGLDDLVTGAGPADPDLQRLQTLAGLRVPNLDLAADAVAELGAADDRLRAANAGEAALDDSLAALLAQAIGHVDLHPGDGTCPICATPSVIDTAWRTKAEADLAQHRRQATEVTSARQEHEAAARSARSLLPGPVPAALTDAPGAMPAELLVVAAARWARAECPAAGASVEDLTSRLRALPELASAVDAVVTAAAAEVARRQDRWQPVAERIAAWLPTARQTLDAAPMSTALAEAADWVREEQDRVRAERFLPVAEAVKETWEQLRHDSNVTIDDLALDGAGTRRRLALGVSVDDAEAPGMSVLSQGELHALSLALFLPRATRDESPFRFVMIDDPVQALDAARVDGLARVLHRVARDRQVVVLTHDERLPDACRRLGIAARVLEVRREPGSVVRVRKIGSPASRLLDDASAIASSDAYPVEARRRVVPGLCRQATEAVAVDLGRRLLLDQGISFEEVDERIAALTTLRSHLAFGLFGDSERTGDVDNRLVSRGGRDAPALVRDLNRGSHSGTGQDAHRLIGRTKYLLTNWAKDLL